MENQNVCVTCLSSDRRLNSIHNIKHIITNINFTELNLSGNICWECRSIIMKFHRFKMRTKQAQATLVQHKQVNMKPLSNLITQNNLQYNYEYCYKEPLTHEKELKLDHDIKEEHNNSISNDNNEKRTEDKKEEQKIECINMKNNKKKRIKINVKDFDKKFIKVVYSEEELVKNREDKRNHYNFKKIPYKCDSCVLGFTRKDTFDMHMLKKHDETIGAYTCSVCQCRFSTESSAVTHKKRHYTNYRCRLCRYDTTELWSANNHCRSKHEKDEVDSIHCKQCEVVVRSPEELEEHMQAKHTVYCNECGVRFKGKHTLRRHKARVHGSPSGRARGACPVCARTFPSRARLEAHAARHSVAAARALAYCAPCRVQYKNIYVYRSHLRNSASHSERAYSCPECNKKFVSKAYWSKHYDFYHLRKSQYNCDICNKLFISEWRLKNHRQKHHGLSRTRDHACDLCGNKFFTISMLRNHQLTHSEQRSYMCEECGDTFKQRPALYTHVKLVHGDRRRH